MDEITQDLRGFFPVYFTTQVSTFLSTKYFSYYLDFYTYF